MGVKELSGFKAIKGTITHKALELLAHKKLCIQNNVDSFTDEETKNTFSIKELTPKKALDISFQHYSRIETHHNFTTKDYRDCAKWLDNAMTFRGGLYNPLKRQVIAPELYFDIEIDQPWAEYTFELPNGTKIKGKLSIKGTIDLITLHPTGVMELLDWKTGGSRRDWAKDKEKHFKDFCIDPQLRMYHYALAKRFPEAKEIFVTIFYIQLLEPFSICFTKDDLKLTENMLRQRFERIKASVRPKRIWGNWKCKKLCHFGKTKHPESNFSICEHTNKELIALGMDRLNAKYIDSNKIASYSGGGGRSEAR